MKLADYRESTCPACGYHVGVRFFDGGKQPLATLGWPRTAAAARALPRFPLDFVRCVDCGHVFNAAFDYANVPYSNEPNLMFNRASDWARFMNKVHRDILARISERPMVVEIGHGDGDFLGSLGDARPNGQYVGFDPNGATGYRNAVEFRAEFFNPTRHLAELRPELVISRHVLEHLVNPLGFLQGLSFAAGALKLPLLAYFEVPCIDRALSSRRTVDFYYEHSSQFTTTSFTRMLERAVLEIVEIGHGYGDEVVFGFARLGGRPVNFEIARYAQDFSDCAETALRTITAQLDELHTSHRHIAVWGGTGKSAAFMSRYQLDAERFPIVVDSDPAKVGTFVPGTGQEIRFRDYLLTSPVEVIIVPPQWRAADIFVEMKLVGIDASLILIEHDGRLVDFLHDTHPYPRTSLS